MSTHFQGHGGVLLAADVAGTSGQPPVILLHGGGQTRYAWGTAVRRLAREGYHVISLDLRGHGESDWAPDGDYSMDAFVGDLMAVIDTLDMPPALVGASLGGATSFLAVGENDRPVASALVLVDIVPHVRPEGVQHIRAFMRGNPEGFASVEEAADAVSRYLPHRPRPKDPSGLRKNLRRGQDGRYYWHWDPAFLDDRGADMSGRMAAAAAGIDIPTLLVRGRNSELVTEAGARRLRSLLPQLEYVDVRGAAHMVAGDRNDAFNSAVTGFLERAAPA
ncbi:MAG TPA: alpha/beta hydrolase [Gammaproteobacteria bacterium]|nr:alpha/beta hydrolase [Gammaproteobacteria bacterium]